MFEYLLSALGLSHNEQKIYTLIVEYGKIGPSQLAKISNINRTTIYGIAKELKEKRLVREDVGAKQTYYVAVQGNELDTITQQEYAKIRRKEALIRQLKQAISETPKANTFSMPKIRFVEENEMLAYLYEATAKWHRSMLNTDTTWWGFQDATFVEHFEEWIDWSWQQAPQSVDLKLLTNESDTELQMKKKKYSKRRNLRFASIPFSVTQLVVGEYVVYVMTRQKPFYLLEIHDPMIAYNLRQLFKSMWQ